jgi:hypothetical protein
MIWYICSVIMLICGFADANNTLLVVSALFAIAAELSLHK